MKDYFKKLPPELKKIIKNASRVSAKLKMPAYLVGGCIRDLILGLKIFDLDIAVEGSGIVFARHLAKKLKSKLIIHERFGTATLILNNGLKVDIATTRKEKYPRDASLPVVSTGLLKEDLMRRDFTINAMAVSIADQESSQLIDPFGGSADLAAGKIRILHDLSFKDDPTRILRAVRFQQRFGFKIEPKTLVLLKQAVASGLLHQVNPHRMRDELILLLKENNPLKYVKKLRDLRGLSFISNKLKVNKLTGDLFKTIDQEIRWFRRDFSGRRPLDNWLIYFTALLKPLGLAEARKVILKLGLCKGESKRIISYLHLGPKLISSLSKKGVNPAKVYSLLEPLSYEAIILLGASSPNKYLKEYVLDFLEIYNGMRLYVSGKDLVSLGVEPGPRYQKIFTKVLSAKLNGQVKSHQDELGLIKKLLKNKI